MKTTSIKLGAALALLAFGGCSIPAGTDPGTKPKFVPAPDPSPYLPTPPPAATRKLVILHTNDEHSHLLGDAPNSEYPFLPKNDGSIDVVAIATRIGKDGLTKGGIVRRQFLINKLRSELKDPVLLLSGGDNTMGTIFHVAGALAAPDYVAMSVLGYDFLTLGNHEFDFGPDFLAQTLHTANRTTFGAAVPVIATNIHFEDVPKDATGKDIPGAPGAALHALYGEGNSGAQIMPWATKTMANGLKVGFIGMLGYDAALVAPGKPPISFSVPSSGAVCNATTACAAGTGSCVRGHCVDPLDALGAVQALAAEVQPTIDALRNDQKVDLVVAMTHLGMTEDVALAEMTTGIDVIIGGHSHSEVSPTVIKSAKTGQSIIVQAGFYGRKLGQLTLTISPTGAVDFVPAESMLHPVDSLDPVPANKLDVQIYGNTNLAAVPPMLAPSFESALKLTGSVLGPVLKGLNALLLPKLGVNLLDPVATSDHDIIGELEFQDSNLSNMVTDAERLIATGGACLNPATDRIVAVQANGVLRDSLRFGSGTPPTTSAADVFRVLPLGASPWEAAANPGYPVAVFRLSVGELFAGVNVGVSKGLEGDSFFLSYSGLRVTYDKTLAPFDAATFNPTSTAAAGRVTKLEMTRDGATWQTVYTYDAANPLPWVARWQNINPATELVTVVTNLYIAGLLDAFGIKPKAANGSLLQLPQTVLCQTGEPNPNCAAGKPALAPCIGLPGTVLMPKLYWTATEVKEWGVLLQFLRGGPPLLNGQIPSLLYRGDKPASPRVISL